MDFSFLTRGGIDHRDALLHRLKNQVTMIGVEVQLALDHVTEAPNVAKQLETIQEKIRALRALLETKPKAPLPKKLPELELCELVDEIIFAFRPICDQKGICIKPYHYARIFVRANAEELKEAIVNIVQNAIQSMSDPPRSTLPHELVMAVDRYSPWTAEILIRDTGIGIPAAELRHILDPYYTTRHDGHGIGLAQANQTIRTLRGKIEIKSWPRSGTEVRVKLPIR